MVGGRTLRSMIGLSWETPAAVGLPGRRYTSTTSKGNESLIVSIMGKGREPFEGIDGIEIIDRFDFVDSVDSLDSVKRRKTP